MDLQADTNPIEIVTDPVCGMTKPKNEMPEISVFLGKTYYFCSSQDREMFDAHPDYWAPKGEKVHEP